MNIARCFVLVLISNVCQAGWWLLGVTGFFKEDLSPLFGLMAIAPLVFLVVFVGIIIADNWSK